MAPPALAVEAAEHELSWAEVVLMVIDYIVLVLLYPPRGEKICLFPSPRALVSGAWG